MTIDVRTTDLPGVLHLVPETHRDDRGFFREILHYRKLESQLDEEFVQFNHSRSRRDVVRGLHYQLHQPQAKLVSVVHGEIYDVVVDIRKGSPTFGEWVSRRLDAKMGNQMFVTTGFAHGFCVLSDQADVVYACSDYYDVEDDRGIRWDDPAIGIDWPVNQPIVSDKDANLPQLSDAEIPAYEGDEAQ